MLQAPSGSAETLESVFLGVPAHKTKYLDSLPPHEVRFICPYFVFVFVFVFAFMFMVLR